MKKRSKPQKLKKVAYRFIHPDSEVGRPMYALLRETVDAHNREVRDARIALAWNLTWQPNVDGRVKLGMCKKASDLDRELGGLEPFDFVIVLRREFWTHPLVTERQRQGLLTHEVLHAAVSHDDRGEPITDECGRQVYRIKGHDIEEHAAVVEHYGFYTKDIEHFYAAVLRGERNKAWVGFETLRDHLVAAGADIQIEAIVSWSESERQEADRWARLQREFEHEGLQLEPTRPAHVTAALADEQPEEVERIGALNPDEQWVVIADYPDYEVSDLGHVRRITSRTFGRAWHVLRTPLRTGYPCVDLCRDGAKKTHHVHRLVAAAFIRPSTGGHDDEVNHLNGDKRDNRAVNLEYTTRQGNQLHAYRMGLQDATGENNGYSKLTEADVLRIREIIANEDRPSYRDIADMFGVCEANIRKVANGETWAHVQPPAASSQESREA